MDDWTAGYVADIGYTFGYYGELNPLRIKLAFLNQQLAFPQFGAACELGFGQGLSINLHAAASTTQWSGTDFNPAQAGFAQELAAASGAGAKLYDDAFADFARRGDLPDFDFIGIHGIWSWISDANRAVIVDFLKRKLKVGGVLYISYNTLPGWATYAPLRHLMTEHAAVIGAPGHGILNRINGALEFTEKLIGINPAYARNNAQVAERVKGLKEQNRHYLAHEYFNRDWHPMYFATMADWLAPAKLQFACSAHYLDHIDAPNLTDEQQAFLQEIPDPMFRQSVRDFVVNQQFRRDYWVKGSRKLNQLEQAEAFRQLRVILTTPRADVRLKVAGALGEAEMNATVYAPILELLADHKARSLGEIEQAMKERGINFGQILQVAMVLAGAGYLNAVQDDSIIAKSKKQTEKLNLLLMSKARSGNEINYLASPVTGGGINADRFHQLFLLGLRHKQQKAGDLAQFVWQILSAQGQRLLKEGKTLDTPEDNLAELTQMAGEFLATRLPILNALQIS